MNKRAAALTAVLALVLVVSACAGIPTSGPVTRVAVDAGFGQSTVRYSPARPAVGASPQQIVAGYLDAMLAFPVSTGTASSFLTSDAAKNWRPLSGVRVYSEPRVTAAALGRTSGADIGDVAVVHVRAAEHAHLDRQGRFSMVTGDTDLTYRLDRVAGQWRISNPQDGLLINSKFFSDYFRPFDIFMFDRPGRRLVPIPVYLAVGDQLSTTLITSLARGPDLRVDDTLQTYVPELAKLRPSVPVGVNGIADVEFDLDFGAMNESARDHLAAQIVWTLRQVPDVNAVRVTGGSTVMSANGQSTEPIGSWGSFGPTIARGHGYAIVDNRIVQIDDGHVEPLTGAWGKDAHRAVFVAVDDSGVAGVLTGREQVRVTNRQGTLQRLIGGNAFVAPRWDDDGGLWLVDHGGQRPGEKTRVRLARRASVETLSVGGLAGLDVTSFALSPDGARYAVTAGVGKGAAIFVGTIRRDVHDRVLGLGDPVRVVTTATFPTSAIWSSGTSVDFLADSGNPPSGSGRQVYTAAIDGSSTTGGATGSGPLLPDVEADVVVVGTGESPPRYATDARHRLWFLPPDSPWRLVKAPAVTGLTYGH